MTPVEKLTRLQPARVNVSLVLELELQQIRGVFTEDFVFLPGRQILSLSNAGHRMRIFGIEMRIVGGHQDVILPDFLERLRHVTFVSFAGDIAIALDVFRRRHLQSAGDLREVFGPLPIVVHPMHPVERPFRAALEEGDFELWKFFKHPAKNQCNQGRSAVQHSTQHVSLKEIIEAVSQLPVAVRMAEERHAELFRSLVIRIESWMVYVAITDMGTKMAGFEPQFFDAPAYPPRHRFWTAGGRHGAGKQYVLMALNQLRPPVVVGLRAGEP